MNSLKKLMTLIRLDWKIMWRRGDTLPSMILFSIASLLIIEFSFLLSDVSQEDKIPACLWLVWLFAALIPFVDNIRREQRDGTAQALRYTAASPSLLGLSKVLSSWIKLTILQAVTIPLAILWFDSPDDWRWLASLSSCLLHGLGLCVLGTLGGSIAAKLERGEAFAAIVVFPLATPLVLSASQAMLRQLQGQALAPVHWGGVLLAILLFLSLSALLWETVLDEA